MTMIRLTHKDKGFDAVRFCATATALDDKRYALSHLQVKDGIMTGTDGQRLHSAFATIPDGYYKVEKVLKREVILTETKKDFPYPDTGRVFFDMRRYRKIRVRNQGYGSHAFAQWKSALYAMIVRAMDTKLTLHFELLDFLDKEYFEAYVSEPGYEDQGPVYFANGNKWAAIMPLRI
jgi:hypothetical protein